MGTLSRAKLERRTEVLVTNGQQAPAQAVLAPIDYNPAALDGGAVRQGLARVQELLAAQKAPRAEAQAREAAKLELDL